ncbi:MAG: hypothetical protein DRP42_00520 [Tenericutes bacterium]|nr:MAG: hypothetical protein DRP42_00520 [Mycoplasmatota bacterium]
MKRKFNLSLFAIPALIFVGFFSATQQVYETTPSQTTMISEEVSQIDDPSFVSTNVERVSRTSAIIYFELNEGGHSGDIHSEDILFILDQSDQTTPMLIDYNNGFGRIAVTNLVPDTFYNFTIEVFFGNAELISSEGSFTTATRDEPSLSNIEIDM